MAATLPIALVRVSAFGEQGVQASDREIRLSLHRRFSWWFHRRKDIALSKLDSDPLDAELSESTACESIG
jgi:hypothetical protein